MTISDITKSGKLIQITIRPGYYYKIGAVEQWINPAFFFLYDDGSLWAGYEDSRFPAEMTHKDMDLIKLT